MKVASPGHVDRCLDGPPNFGHLPAGGGGGVGRDLKIEIASIGQTLVHLGLSDESGGRTPEYVMVLVRLTLASLVNEVGFRADQFHTALPHEKCFSRGQRNLGIDSISRPKPVYARFYFELGPWPVKWGSHSRPPLRLSKNTGISHSERSEESIVLGKRFFSCYTPSE